MTNSGACLRLQLVGLLGLGWLSLGCSDPQAAEPLERIVADASVRQEEELPQDFTPDQTGVDWPGFLGPAGDSSSPEKGLIAPWPEGGLKILWKISLKEGYAAPTIYRGRLFVLEREGDTARLRCLHENTRELLWKFEYSTEYADRYGYSGGPRCCAVCDGNRVYLHGVEGVLHCLRVSDGKMLWRVDERKEFGIVQNFFGVGSSPVISDDLLIVHVGGSPQSTGRVPFSKLEGNGTAVVAFDKYTGEIRYKLGDELASYSSPVLTTIQDRSWCFLLARGGLVGFDPTTGKQDFYFPWRASKLESVNAANPVVVGNRVLISETYGPGSACLLIEDGKPSVVWQDELRNRNQSLQAHWCTPIHHQGYVYGCSGRHTNNADLRCLDLQTGEVQWTQTETTRCSLLKVDGHLISLGEYGELRLLKLNPKKYEEVSRVWFRDPDRPQVPGLGEAPLVAYPAWAAPVLSHGRLYVRGKGILVCLQAMKDPAKR